MLPSQLSFILAVLGTTILQAKLATAVAEPPACSLKCTLAILNQAGCPLSDIQNCLCTNETLQYGLSLCVLGACDTEDQMAAIEILQNEICSGVLYPSRKVEIIRAEIILAGFTFPIIILRLISRVWVAHRLWWDDWMVIIAAVFMVPNTVIPIYTAYHGFGVHIWNVRVQDQVILQQLYYVAQIFYALIRNIAKFSILFLYLRIFPTPRFRFIVKIVMAFIACHTIAFTVGIGLQCLPVRSLWDLTIHGKCLNIHAFAISGAAFSIFEDLVIMFLPTGELKGLNLTLRKRMALCLMFALGSFACITSMIRLKYLKNFYRTIDVSWDSTDVAIWSDIETYTAVICSCLMCIRPLLIKCFPALFPITHLHSTSTSTSTSDFDPNPISQSSSRRTWTMGLGYPWGHKAISSVMFRNSKLKSSLRSLRGGNRRETLDGVNEESMRTIIIQVVGGGKGEGSEEGGARDGGFEMGERGATPSFAGRDIEGRSTEDVGFHEGR